MGYALTINDWMAVFFGISLLLTGLNAWLDYVEEGERVAKESESDYAS
ncbi:hypothetical protein [Mycobacterium sp. Root265]|nr:hypothetical protein [Mycobacterium sp. Root265]